MFKLSSTIIRSFWLAVLLVLFGLGSSIAASPLSPALMLFGYDAQSQASVAYDVGFRSIFGYDSAPVPIAGGEVNPTVGASNLFGEFGEFLAAEGTVAGNSLATAQNQAVFWSGVPNGAGTAAQWAAENGGVTLEQTIAARGAQLPAWDASNPASVSAWTQASQQFAAGASGDITVLQGNAVRVNSIWGQTEFPALQANPNVTSITSANPTTGQQVLLWSR